jgi:hypothetical protein
MKPTIILRTRLFITIFIFALLLGGCLSQSQQLTAMQNSSVASMQLTTAREVNRAEQDRGSTLGKPEPAQFIVDYEPVGNHTKEDVYNEIIASLQRDNWQPDPLNASLTDSYKATLPQGNFALVVNVRNIQHYSFIRVTMTTDPT